MKSKMADIKPEVHVTKPVDVIESKFQTTFSQTGNSIALEKMSPYESRCRKSNIVDIKPDVHEGISLACLHNFIYTTRGFRRQLTRNNIVIDYIEFFVLDNNLPLKFRFTASAGKDNNISVVVP